MNALYDAAQQYIKAVDRLRVVREVSDAVGVFGAFAKRSWGEVGAAREALVQAATTKDTSTPADHGPLVDAVDPTPEQKKWRATRLATITDEVAMVLAAHQWVDLERTLYAVFLFDDVKSPCALSYASNIDAHMVAHLNAIAHAAMGTNDDGSRHGLCGASPAEPPTPVHS